MSSEKQAVVDALFSSNLATRVVESNPGLFFRSRTTIQAKVYQELSENTKKNIHKNVDEDEEDNEEENKIEEVDYKEEIQLTSKRLNIRKALSTLTDIWKMILVLTRKRKIFLMA